MTRPGYVMVEHPVGEAEAMLKERFDGDLTLDEAGACVNGYDRLQRAVNIEREPGGSCQPVPDQPADVAA